VGLEERVRVRVRVLALGGCREEKAGEDMKVREALVAIVI
jgi:hypothetical protein